MSDKIRKSFLQFAAGIFSFFVRVVFFICHTALVMHEIPASSFFLSPMSLAVLQAKSAENLGKKVRDELE